MFTTNERTALLARPLKDTAVRTRWQERLQHFTWAWFEVTMSTGGLATLLGQQPYTFTGLQTIGKTFFILNIVLFVVSSGCITYRFCNNKGSLMRSLHHPHESFYFGAFFVSVAIIFYGVQQFGVPSCGPWLVKALEVSFWTQAGIVMLVAVFQYHVIFDEEQLPVSDAMPHWILPVYPFLILGVLGSSLLKDVSAGAGLPIFIGSLAFQGLGWTVAFFMLTIYVTRLVNSELPEAPKRPGMYVAVGPASYTANTLVTLGMQAPKHIPINFLGITSFLVGDAFKAIGVVTGIFLWLVAFWFSALATVSVIFTAKDSHFTLNYWAFIFPNVGLVIALIHIANALESDGLRWIGSGATVILSMLWFWIAFLNVKAILEKKVLYPGTDEDMEDIEGHADASDGEEEV
ncbi:C4-dicarboxylate transporter/malic acid transport protein-like protein [Dothidotthia symphoricarpi CBS 119687]|uniref:C4-dicarboxylate transporter/malic acid transport protein-like protein n=1 Tax=Dothidotthia symphoricarpi CBS 119687 TaxID=1392245 RepID=A0A6A5ZWV3_9PLEO|nr:C4-dicarboxylate transporter/malic acid transport protein-like protein [Dothidotthia symphoricarpi CBS 119687]KAF2123373.1 C4-dicarboxylate transporter/malic acid transport protein-like protein [Dothidotthia symphoricarpi CBS 119687]